MRERSLGCFAAACAAALFGVTGASHAAAQWAPQQPAGTSGAASGAPTYPGYSSQSYSGYPSPGHSYGATPQELNGTRYEGGPVPAGYHVEDRPSYALSVSGPIVLGVPYLLGLAFAASAHFENQGQWLALPGIGPWLTLGGRRADGCNDSSACIPTPNDRAVRTFLVLDGVLQAGGAIMFIYGVSTPRRIIARDFVGRLQLTPASVGPTAYGALLRGAF